MIRELIMKNRSYRRFYQDVKISREELEEFVDLARLSSSGSNRQPLKYILSYEEERNKLIFSHLGWAKLIKDWGGPAEGERPAAYLIMLGDKEISPGYMWDPGIACQSILLGAAEKGLGGCIINSVAREALGDTLHIPERYEIILVLALGKPRETVVIEELQEGQSTHYWRDENQVHHVPKRSLAEIIVRL
ncbi:MAG: nitroreductase family protein [Clostridia bacterium]|jgi:nitroreductase|nr:nitroreductase family protein [Clostridia bacterium]